jgi:uncharacterized protein (TIGR03067 family)
MKRVSLLIGSITLSLAFLNSTLTSGADKAAASSDTELIQGTWQLLYAETDATQAPAKTVQSIRIEIKGNSHTVYFGDKAVVHDVSFVINPSANPKTTEDTINEGPDKGKPIRGIYQLKDDTLISCVAKPGDERPKEFVTSPGSGHTLRVFMKIPTHDDAKQKAIREEYIRFGGAWRFHSMEVEGQNVSEENTGASRLIIQGNRFFAKHGKQLTPGEFKIDPTVTPKTIDVTFTQGDGKGSTLKGIYELTDDTYKVALGTDGQPRPNQLSSKPGSNNGYQILKREVTQPAKP